MKIGGNCENHTFVIYVKIFNSCRSSNVGRNIFFILSRICRQPDSLRKRATVLMDTGLSQAYAIRRIGVTGPNPKILFYFNQRTYSNPKKYSMI